MEPSAITDRIRGVLLGQAVGDALGLGAEFMTAAEVAHTYPDGLHHYEQIVADGHRSRFERGAWSDDTAMMLCIVHSLIEKQGHIDLHDIACRFKAWWREKPMGIGTSTNNVLALGDYTVHPEACAEMVWRLSRCQNAPNGGVMRTGVIGLLHTDVARHAVNVCRLTHADPRCAGSCAVIATLVHTLVYENSVPPLSLLLQIASPYGRETTAWLTRAAESPNLHPLQLDDSLTMGYTLKTMAAAVWALYHCHNFTEGLLAVVNAGGDADTNAAVTGCVLGARYGAQSIPPHLADGLLHRQELAVAAQQLADLFGY